MIPDKLPGGLWPVILTTFKENLAIDHSALRELIRFYVRSGAGGIFANCLSSEMFELTPEERIITIQIVQEEADGKLPVVATGTFSSDPAINTAFIKKVYDLGVTAVIINSNQLNKESDTEEEFKSSLENLLENTGEIPLGIYECPVPYKRLFSPALLNIISRTGRFLYFKDTSCDITAIKYKIDAIKGSYLGLYNAHQPTGLASLKIGASGISPIGANYFPEFYSYLSDNFNNPSKNKEIETLNLFLNEIDPLLHRFYPYSAKLVLQQRGLNLNTSTRSPISNMQSGDVLKLNNLMQDFKELAQELEIEMAV